MRALYEKLMTLLAGDKAKHYLLGFVVGTHATALAIALGAYPQAALWIGTLVGTVVGVFKEAADEVVNIVAERKGETRQHQVEPGDVVATVAGAFHASVVVSAALWAAR